MKYETTTYLIAFFGLATAAPMPVPENIWSFSIPRAMLRGREVPQEHSHDRFLDGVRVNLALNNPNNISDPVFGLLGDAAAAAGAGSITNLECLHQATADQAFTNAKAAGNVTGQADALMYAALERNTGKVGLASVSCNETAVNPEIEAVQQHQDPALSGAAATNKAIVLALAQQLASIGADPQEALLSGTFAPGNVDDDTGKGNSCDTVNDPDGGCIFSQNLLVDDATAAEISAAVASIASASGSASGSASATGSSDAAIASASDAAGSASVTSSSDAACSVAFVTETASASPVASVASVATTAASVAAAATSAASAASAASTASSSSNVQTFTGDLGGLPLPVVESTGDRPFSVNGDTFVNKAAALQRSCSVQNNACANAANSGSLAGTSTADCNKQEDACNAAAGA